MALKDTWKDLKNYIEGVPDSGEMASADDINEIAQAVIQIESNMGDWDGNANNIDKLLDKILNPDDYPISNKEDIITPITVESG